MIENLISDYSPLDYFAYLTYSFIDMGNLSLP